MKERALVYQIPPVLALLGEEAVTLPASLHPASRDEMSQRARIYQFAGVFRYSAYGIFAILFPEQFAAAAFIPVVKYVDLALWGAIFMLTAGFLFLGATLRNRTIARLGLIVSAGVTGVLATGLWIGAVDIWLSGGKATALFAATLTALVIKDLACCTDPMKTPLELTAMWRRVALGGNP